MGLSLTALVGCAGGAADTRSTADTTSASAAGGTAASASVPGGPSPASPPSTPVLTPSPGGDGAAGDEAPPDAPAAQPTLLLEAGGLGVVLDETRVEHLPFGTAATQVRAVVARLLGRLTTSRAECAQGARTVSSVRGFQLLFRGSRFVGWADAGARGRRLTTGDGIGVGITIDALEHSGTDVRVGRADGGTAAWTSGPGGLDGRATSASPRGRVTLVSSGETCSLAPG